MRTQALAKPEVGDFLSKHYIAVHDKVGTFTVNVASDGKTPNRDGGNVAAFFCTPSGYVIHAVAGPRTSEAFLAEAKWATAVYTQILKDTGRNSLLPPADRISRVASALKQAHSDALELLNNPNADGPAAELVRHTPSSDSKLKGLEAAGRKQREQVHRLFKSKAFEPLATVGPEVYSQILGEKVTAEHVKLNNAPEARQAARPPGQSLAEFYSSGGSAGQPAAPLTDKTNSSSEKKSGTGARKTGKR